MITSLLIRIKRACPRLWRMVENANGRIVRMRYPRLDDTASGMLPAPQSGGLRWSVVTGADIPELSRFLLSLPPGSTTHFSPHPFDTATMRHMLRCGSFLMLTVRGTDGDICGYHFLRCFADGRAFHGLVVDPSCSGRGIGTAMWSLAARISAAADLRMMATISESNLPSLASCRRGYHVEIAGHLPDSYLLLHCHPKI